MAENNTQNNNTDELQELKRKKEQEQDNTVSRVIRGVNDVFEKYYNFKEIKLDFNIKLRVPNALEQGTINAMRSNYLGGMDLYQSDEIYKAYQMLATIQVVGVEVPDELSDPEKIYNLIPLVRVYDDWIDFLGTFVGNRDKEISDSGGMQALVKRPLSRNMWAIMREFKVLPTDPNFKNLDSYQIQFIIESMNLDAREMERRSKGYDSTVEDDDTSWYDESQEEFEPVPDFLDAEDLAKQAYDRLSESERIKMTERAEAEEDDEEAREIHKNKMAQIQKNIEELDKQVNNTSDNQEEYSQQSIEDALNEFDDDDLYM
ncbi:tail tape measure chaperone [Staphylococcus phage Terranova]|nr:tail tape measure chaperone [Staphylococcus phage Terranova]